MLTSLEIENFKGVAARQRIDFAPLTLLFGANSAGKSTILQALVYLHELMERGAADVDRTELGGHVLELGGFSRLVHRHQPERAMVLRAESSTPGALERLGRDLRFVDPHFDPEDSTYFEPMKAYLEVAQKRRSVGDLKLQFHFAIGPAQAEQQSRLGRRSVDDRSLALERVDATERTLRPLLEPRVEVRVCAWTQGLLGRMHNRYVLSEIGGVALQTGLDQRASGYPANGRPDDSFQRAVRSAMGGVRA